MTINEIKINLRKHLNEEKYIHSINVMDEAAKLARVYNCNVEQAIYSGLLHDCAKGFDGRELMDYCRRYNIQIDDVCGLEPKLLHGPVGALFASLYYGIKDKNIAEAIRTHTIGEANMTLLQKIIFLADIIEPERNFEGVEQLRDEAYRNIDNALLLAAELSIRSVLDRGLLLHPKTVEMRNSIIAARFC